MIRASLAGDTVGMMEVAEACGLFEGDQLDTLRATIDRFFGGAGDGDEFWLTDIEGTHVAGVACVSAEVMTDRVWNLLFVAVHPDSQGQGRGGAILDAVERELRRRGARMLIVETSGGDDFDRTRLFYGKQGFEQEGAVRDFYAAGADKIVFRKLL